jgi:hypothetical protein
MSKQLRELAKCILNHPDFASVSAAIELAELVMADSPEDDDEPVDVEWLASLGFKVYDHGLAYLAKANLNIHVAKEMAYIELLHDNMKLPHLRTRGDVRRLARALRVELGEKR